jgi:hypothetical protein
MSNFVLCWLRKHFGKTLDLCGKYKLTALFATNARIKIFGFEEPRCGEKGRCLASLLISAEKLIENYKAHTTSQLGSQIVFLGFPVRKI